MAYVVPVLVQKTPKKKKKFNVLTPTVSGYARGNLIPA